MPDGYTGVFYIVYQDSERNPSSEIIIDDKGIGINPGEPDLKQLFNANRIFRFEGEERQISILNPNGYGKGLDAKSKSVLEDQGVVIVQKGFNQSPRNDWNTAYGENVKDKWNIEYFEIRERIDQ